MKTDLHNYTLILSLVFFVLGLPGCGPPVEKYLGPPTGTVSGTVLFRPGYDGMPPGDYIPPVRPQAGIKVYLLRVPDDAPPLIGRDDILAEVITDSLGHYSIDYLAGQYYLAVYEPTTGMILRGTAGAIKMDNFEISEMVPVTIKPNETLMQDFELHGIVAM